MITYLVKDEYEMSSLWKIICYRNVIIYFEAFFIVIIVQISKVDHSIIFHFSALSFLSS